MFTFELRPQDLFNERSDQMRKWGIPRATIDELRSRVHEMWSDDYGSWTYEWSKEAERAVAKKKWLLASALYGAAGFPVACTPDRVIAHANQVDCYVRASSSFPCAFDRRLLRIHSGVETLGVVVHLFAPRDLSEELPLVLLSGGVDTHKMELHRLALILCRLGNFRVAAMDMPGTGETPGPLQSDSHFVYERVLDALAPKSSTKRGIIGLSFGGHWAAKLALRESVEAAVNLGGPVGSVPLDHEFVMALPNGMTGIVCNALGMSAMPSESEADQMLRAFSLRAQSLLEPSHPCAPLLAINGSDDPYIPQEETRVFAQLKNAEAWIVEHADHCAASHLPRLVPAIVAWMRIQLHGATLTNAALEKAARVALPKMQQLRAARA